MGNGSGVSRGDRNRNARLERLRALVPVTPTQWQVTDAVRHGLSNRQIA